MNSSVELMPAISENANVLAVAVAAWNDRQARTAAGTAVTTTDLLIVGLHRLRDVLVAETREWDQTHRPHDPRD